jgi:mRNA interferase RelE/StbE
MKINIRKSAVKDLRKISKDKRKIIHSKIKELEKFPNLPNIKKLTNFEPAYCLRLVNFRILFDVLEEYFVIGRILHRKDSYTK